MHGKNEHDSQASAAYRKENALMTVDIFGRNLREARCVKRQYLAVGCLKFENQ